MLAKVRSDYRIIAREFSKTRSGPWPEFSSFLKMMRREYGRGKIFRLLDAGCGNGRLCDFLKNEPLIYTGLDNNRALLKIARKIHPDAKFILEDAVKLPFPARKFSAVWCIAVLHHLPDEKLRLAALKEIKRVLVPGGFFAITVWNLWQKKYRKYIDKKTGDALIPWKAGKKVVNRFYHAFTQKQLRGFLRGAGFSRLRTIKSAHNIAIVATVGSINL